MISNKRETMRKVFEQRNKTHRGWFLDKLIFTAGIKEQLVLKKVIYNGHIQAINNVRNA